MASSDHFAGKDVEGHLKAARLKGANASSEIHGTELPGSFVACCDSAKTTSTLLAIIAAITYNFSIERPTLFWCLFLTSCALMVWHTGRSALLGWFRLERLHRLIEEERYEIEHHRDQERQELKAMYAAKGLSGKLLDEVIDILMADDNRLLNIMLEEELGLSLEVYEHPLKQAAGALIGTTIAALLISCASLIHFYAIAGTSLLLVGFFSQWMAGKGGNQKIRATIWNSALFLVALGTAFFLSELVAFLGS